MSKQHRLGRLEYALGKEGIPVLTTAHEGDEAAMRQVGDYLLRKVLNVRVPRDKHDHNGIEARKVQEAAVAAFDAVIASGESPFRHPRSVIASDAMRDAFWQIIGGGTAEHDVQKRRERQAVYAKQKRASLPKPEDALTGMEFAALVLLDDSPLSQRERQALINVVMDKPADEKEKRARTRMRATLRKTLESREALNVLLEELTRRYDQLDRIEQMVTALYQAHLIAPLEEEADAILDRESEVRGPRRDGVPGQLRRPVRRVLRDGRHRLLTSCPLSSTPCSEGRSRHRVPAS